MPKGSRLKRRIKDLYRYKAWKKAVVKRDGKCMRCGSTENLTAHHLTPLCELIEMHGIENHLDANKYDDMWKLELGICLCKKCHDPLHNKKSKKKLEQQKHTVKLRDIYPELRR